MPRIKRIKTLERKLRHNCSFCQATYTLLETHLTKKDNPSCPANCLQIWEAIILKHCQEKVLGAEVIEKTPDYE